MQVSSAMHAAQPWVINEIAPDFTLLDVWELPVEGRAEDVDDALALLGSFDPAHAGSAASRALFWVRLRLGELFGWDDGVARPIPGCTETTLADRLPPDLRGSADVRMIGDALHEVAGGFTPLYRAGNEWAAEISNATVHGVLHLAWVQQSADRYRAHMAVYVKPRGRLGAAYLRFIDPFRHCIVYPALLRQIGRRWHASRGQLSTSS